MKISLFNKKKNSEKFWWFFFFFVRFCAMDPASELRQLKKIHEEGLIDEITFQVCFGFVFTMLDL